MTNKVYLFIGVSALIHISVYGIFTNSLNKLPIMEHGRSAISVEITQSESIVKNQRPAKPVQKAEVPAQVEQQSVSPTKSTSVIKSDALNSKNNFATIQDVTPPIRQNVNHQKTEDLLSQDSDTPFSDNEVNSAAVIAVLREELSKYFYYPASAQRKSWEGMVVLSFTIMPDGVIHEIHVNKSSGYDVLDDAAIEALTEVRGHEELALAVNGNSHQQLLPVTYRLTE